VNVGNSGERGVAAKDRPGYQHAKFRSPPRSANQSLETRSGLGRTRRSVRPVPANPHRAASRDDIDNAPALGNVHLPADGQPSRRSPDLAHQRSPAVRPRRPGRVRRADGSLSGALAKQPQDHLLQSRRFTMRAGHTRSITPGRASPAPEQPVINPALIGVYRRPAREATQPAWWLTDGARHDAPIPCAPDFPAHPTISGHTSEDTASV
jgi:hypothetical protein